MSRSANRRPVALALVAALALPAASCESLQDPGMMAALGTGLGAAGISSLAGGHRSGVAAAAAVAVATHLIVLSTYRASQAQRAEAERRAQAQRKGYSRTAKAKGAKYVAVPVPKRQGSKSKGKNDLMIADAESGKLVSNKVYEVPEAKMNNSVAKLGNHDTLLYSGYRGI